MRDVLLIDAINFIYKGKIKFAPKDVGATPNVIVYNFFRNLRALFEQFNPSKVFFCSEGKDNFRYKLFPEYKANRILKYSSDKTREDNKDFERQRDIIFDLIKYLPIQVVKANGFEADDVLATLADDLKNENIVIVSGDSDLIQLLQKGYKQLRLYHPIRKEFITAPKYHYLAYKCVAGDKKSDNIPGIMSEKKALELVNDINKFREFLTSEENRSEYSLNKSLIELQIIEQDKLEFIDYQINFDLLKTSFLKMEFNSLIEEKYWNRFVDTFTNLEKQ